MGTYSPQGMSYNAGGPRGYPGSYNVRNYTVPGPVDVMVPNTRGGMPPGGMPPVMVRPGQSYGTQGIPQSVLQPRPQVAGVNYAQTTPMGSSGVFPSIAEIPPPHLVAPYLFSQQRQASPYPVNNAQYNYYQTPWGYPQYPQYRYPYQYPQQPQNPAANPLNRPEQPPQQQPQPQPEPPKQQTPPPANLNLARLDNATVNLLNERLNNSNSMVRSDAAMEFYKILEANPDLSHPESPYRPIVEAFMTKILKDPNPVVRQPALLAFEMNYFYSPSPAIIGKLEDLAKGSGLHHLEPQIVKGILASINAGKMEPPGPYTGGALETAVADANQQFDQQGTGQRQDTQESMPGQNLAAASLGQNGQRQDYSPQNQNARAPGYPGPYPQYAQRQNMPGQNFNRVSPQAQGRPPYMPYPGPGQQQGGGNVGSRLNMVSPSQQWV